MQHEPCEEPHVTLEEFRASLTRPEPLPALDWALQALWWEAQGHWDRAHACAQVTLFCLVALRQRLGSVEIGRE